MQWIKDELDKEIKYTSLLEYSKRHFGNKFKVARKSKNIKPLTNVLQAEKTKLYFRQRKKRLSLESSSNYPFFTNLHKITIV